MVVCGAILAYACSSKDSGTSSSGGTPPVPEGGTTDGPKPDDDSGNNPDGAKGDSSIPPSGNPIDGITAANVTAVPGFTAPAVATEGPIWHTDGLYFSVDVPDGFLVKLTPPSTTTQIHRVATAGNIPLGNTFDGKNNTFITCEATPNGGGQLVRTAPTGTTGTPIALSFDAGSVFDSPNDVVVRKSDGMIYVTDPGYQTTPLGNNHIWRIKPTGLTAGDIFETSVEGRPNGIALSVDQKTLYVGFTDPPAGVAPNIMKYALTGADGVIGAGTKFADVGAGSAVDGIKVDTSGNIYAAVKTGVDVFKADGSAKWGHIPAPALATNGINSVAFGGADHKTLYMTSDNGMWQVTVKIAGLE